MDDRPFDVLTASFNGSDVEELQKLNLWLMAVSAYLAKNEDTELYIQACTDTGRIDFKFAVHAKAGKALDPMTEGRQLLEDGAQKEQLIQIQQISLQCNHGQYRRLTDGRFERIPEPGDS